MPQQSGEESLCTLFADVHYYFSHPNAKPVHHRFDKSSYLYLYHNPNEHRGRIEIANYAGTPDQDAFMGYLDNIQLNRTHKQPNLFTITVDPSTAGSTPSSPQQDYTQWHLPSPDQRNEGKYMFRLHTVDLYMWTEKDANTLLAALQRILQPHQLRILDAPSHKSRQPEHSETMSPVVKKLEQMAVSSPHQYRSTSVSTTQSLPRPPALPAVSGEPPQGGTVSHVPIAYNPAAPAAPEPIAHREKTPPPVDTDADKGVAQYVMPHQHSYYTTHQSLYMPGPPSATQHQHVSSAAGGSFAQPPPPPPPPSQSETPLYPQFFAPPPAQTPKPMVHSSADPQTSVSTGYPSYTTTAPPPPPPPQQQLPYQQRSFTSHSQYPYGPASQAHTPASEYSMHQQAYRPTQEEVAHENGVQTGSGPAGGNKRGGTLARLESKFSNYLKALDSKV